MNIASIIRCAPFLIILALSACGGSSGGGGGSGTSASGTSATKKYLAAGIGHTCVRLNDDGLMCWGLNEHFQLGNNNPVSPSDRIGDQPNEMAPLLQKLNLGTGRTAAEVVAGGNHTCARLDNGSVKCWGSGVYGQLGYGASGDRAIVGDEAVNLGSGRTAVEIAAGLNHTCARLDNGSVKCWGRNLYGQLGIGQFGVAEAANRGDDPNEMGDQLPAVSLGTGRTAVEIVVGGDYTCARLDNGSVKCWGLNNLGQLGLGDKANRGGQPDEMGDNLPAVSLGTGRTAVEIVAGGNHACVRLDNGLVKCWGYNNFGELGLGDRFNRGDQPNEMGDNLPAVSLGTGRTAVEIVAGLVHTCARLDNGSVKCWGYNFVGQLGLGDMADRGDQSNEMGDNLPAVSLGTGRTAVEIVAGDYHICARLDNGGLKCWGYNSDGQLGLGDTANRGDQLNEMGDNLPYVNY